MAPLSIKEAQAIVDDVQVTNGGLSPEVQEALPKGALKALRNLQSIAGGSIEHVAEDLYDADTRFIFELIQNAEDNRYDLAAAREEEPFLQFTLHDDHLTVDSNEDGFTEADVRAICSIHRSSKKQLGGYIGHKGIGFKSVFKIAHKVCIQSGPFCFYFEHRRGDGGLAMITPYNQTPQELPPCVNTRITLWLLHSEDFATRASELEEIPDTLLLFLRKLRKLTIDIPTLHSQVSYERRENMTESLITMIKQTSKGEDKRFYHVQKSTLSNLPEHHSRQEQHETDLILAFPVDQSFNPVIEPQFVYSFLPMRNEGFNFLIQSDFITQANRQGIHRCPRNYAIREAICDLFVQATQYLCNHDVLAYEWLQYLPGSQINDSFWADLPDMIIDALKESKVLFCRSHNVLKYPGELQRLSSRHCDRHGQPLLEDIHPDVYLSQSYTWSRHAERLLELGVTNLSYNSILDRLSPYLLGDSPRYLDPTLDDDWHTRIADLLLRAIKTDRKGGKITERITKMTLIPSSQGILTSAKISEVYFPTDDNGNGIPEDLKDILTVDRRPLENSSRMALFVALGVTHCKPSRVIQSILKRYNKSSRITLNDSVGHLSYLFRTLGKDEALDKRIFIMNQNGTPIYRAFPTLGVPITKDDLYFETLGDYGTKQLAEAIAHSPDQPDSPGFDMHIIHSAYINSVSPGTLSHSRTLEKWLEEVAFIRRIPRLKHSQADRLSDLSAYLANYQPMTLIGLLKENWKSYQAELTPKVIGVLKDMGVPCQNQSRISNSLCWTYYPSKEMRQLSFDAGVENNFEFFLNIPDTLATDDADGWEFLATLGVTLQPDAEFFLAIFSWLLEGDVPSTQAEAAVFRMYKELSVRFSDKSEELMEHIFNEHANVWIPATGQESARLLCLEDCVWDGHPCLTKSLAQYPQYTNDLHVAHLFKNVLHVADADLETYLLELQSRKDASLTNPSNVSMDDLRAIYGMIAESINSSKDEDIVLKDFHQSLLVYLPAEHRWLAPEHCLWAETPKIGAQFGISTVYPELEDFFRGPLKIQVPTVATYIVQLRGLVSNDRMSISEIKATIHKINLLSLGANDRQGLVDLRFLPVTMPGGRVEVLKASETFFIVDRIEHKSAFEGKVPLLDFSLGETRQLHQLLLFLGLAERYTSAAVQEKTVVEEPSEASSSVETGAFRKKARHIHRCVLHYNAANPTTGDPNGLQRLQRALVYMSGGFKKTLELCLNEVAATVQSDTGLVHVDNSRDELRVYIPRNPRDRQRCYSLHLPQALVRYFELRDAAASLMLQLVFVTAEDFIGDLLDGNGIVGLPSGIPELSEIDDVSPFGDTDTIDDILNTPGSSSESREESLEITSSHRTAVSPSPRPFMVHRPQPISPDAAEPFVPETHYIQLLDDVIKLARQVPLVEALYRPEATVLGLGTVAHELAFGVRSQGQMEHDIKIGAAGELFVFELLLTHALPGFTLANWRSTIRKKVSVHPEYHDLLPWNGAETADIVYHDSNSALTTALIGMGYLSDARWHGANPTYYIEVKTTTGEWDNAFFMSKSQYRRVCYYLSSITL
ncbi:hypothetical protein BDW59DRAFT_160094 [Aspergillus cavernicola]|uniref:Protein NO VEIN C-terminal domain-containing protein n=1 Tax=Aspergillus cavernicola TaxID=176166 RepID=A0ABR4IJ73_9EURO